MKTKLLFAMGASLFLLKAQAFQDIRPCVVTGISEPEVVLQADIRTNWDTKKTILSFVDQPWRSAVAFDFVYSTHKLSVAVSPDEQEMAVIEWQDRQNGNLKVGDRLNPVPTLGKYKEFSIKCEL